MKDKIEKNKNIIIKLSLVISVVFNVILLITFFSEKAHFYLKHEDYPFLSKRIFTQKPNDVIINFVPLRKALKEYVLNQGDKIGLYFEYLPSGVSVGVNDRDEMKLSSLSKVPLAMSILKKVEKG